MTGINVVHIKNIQHNIGNGVTEPKVAVTDDDKFVIIKLFNGPQGNLVLFNEYFCYRLAIAIGLKMPVSGVAVFDDKTAVFNDCADKTNFGLCFYSQNINKTTVLSELIIPLLKNKEDFYKLLLFDHVIFNTDRNPGNLLVQFYKNNVSLYVIDHTHVFINQSIWDKECLRLGMAESDYRSTEIIEANTELYEMFFSIMPISKKYLLELVEQFKSIISTQLLERIVADVPESWKPNKEDIDALIGYIMYRTDHLSDIVEMIVTCKK